jgi:hypothetical protein
MVVGHLFVIVGGVVDPEDLIDVRAAVVAERPISLAAAP